MKRAIPAALGGEGWSPRTRSMIQEIGELWRTCGVDSEWRTLRAVLLHRPGPELEASADPNSVLMLQPLDLSRASRQFAAIVEAYEAAGVRCDLIDPGETPPPNLMFVADLFLMTREGAVLGRAASTVRAGEERYLAQAFAKFGIPILMTVRGSGTFEGSDAAWLGPEKVLLAEGLRTNQEGARQVEQLLRSMGIEVLRTELPSGTMHLMGQVRFLDADLALVWDGRVTDSTVQALYSSGFQVLFNPDEREAESGMALNFTTLGPRHVLMPAGNPITQAFLERRDIRCDTVEVDELSKAAGAIGCLTGVVEREHG